MTRLVLYTTLGCHLCERMEALVVALADPKLQIEPVEIADDASLLARYGERIPVLCAVSCTQQVHNEQAVSDPSETLEGRVEARDIAVWLAARGWLAQSAQVYLKQAPTDQSRSDGCGTLVHGRRVLGKR
ncbi:glutaredoxin family protein [Halomonas binhaiensis]|uniref:Glutaredoxin family protein n=1 Tax=Halomonas binhaiensis TaxID=2562282 RepID=A0A5C1NE40_9GAMM|nr:glutaredoxin family protein [Halomonas binhaiensis]QEM81140.1 glutaredoxin family protein [Halomonas binhaiensis]